MKYQQKRIRRYKNLVESQVSLINKQCFFKKEIAISEPPTDLVYFFQS